MNIFVLSTGRCGSKTFVHACEHMTNYTAGHESKKNCIGEERLRYPVNHIESDNRLSWFLGRLDQTYGDDAVYVHLLRDKSQTAASFEKRYDRGIIKAYREGILMGRTAHADPLDVCRDYYDTVNRNIEYFLKDKTRKMEFHLENAKDDFLRFWEMIEAKGDLDAALAEWDTAHNATGIPKAGKKQSLFKKLRRKYFGHHRKRAMK